MSNGFFMFYSPTNWLAVKIACFRERTEEDCFVGLEGRRTLNSPFVLRYFMGVRVKPTVHFSQRAIRLSFIIMCKIVNLSSITSNYF